MRPLVLVIVSKEALYCFLTSAKGPLFVGWLVFEQDYTRTAKRISTEVGWRTALGPE